MGVTIENGNCSMNLGYGGFARLRIKVSELAASDIQRHYKKLQEGMFLFGTIKEEFFKDYNAEIQRLSKKYNGEKDHILDFLYASDCGGEMDTEHCKTIYGIIKDYDDDICYGYRDSLDCAMFKDFKNIVKDCIYTNTNMTWF